GGSVVTSAVAAEAPADRVRSPMQPRPLVAAMRPYADPASSVPPRFDLRAGNVDRTLFPLRAWRQCTTAAQQVPPPGYGDPLGEPALRATLAHWMGRSRGVVCPPLDVMVTSGALHGLDLVARVMLEPGDMAAVEEPGYPPAADLLS